MVTPTFDIMGMAKRVDSQVKRRRVTRVLAGIGLVGAAVWRGGVLAPLVALGGATLVVRGLTDEPLAETGKRLKNWLSQPSTHRFGDGKRDLVDEASWQSFPASDPPGYSLGGRPGVH